MKPRSAAGHTADDNIVRFVEPDAGHAVEAPERARDRDETDASLDDFAAELARALDPEAKGTSRDAWVAVLMAAQKLCARVDIAQGTGAFAAMALAMRELDKGHVPLPLQPDPVSELPNGWRRWFRR